MRQFLLDLGDHQVRLSPGVWRIGRDAVCEIRLASDTVSRRHARLRVSQEQVRLEDEGSRNGVRLNGERIYGSAELSPGDRFAVGAIEMRLVEADETDAPRFGTGTRPMPKPGARSDEPLAVLSQRERLVFERLAHGRTQREVAEELGVSIKTIETYRARLGEKLDVRTRADLVRLALETGVLRPDA